MFFDFLHWWKLKVLKVLKDWYLKTVYSEHSDRTRRNGDKLEEGSFRLVIRMKRFADKDGEAVKQTAHRSCG